MRRGHGQRAASAETTREIRGRRLAKRPAHGRLGSHSVGRMSVVSGVRTGQRAPGERRPVSDWERLPVPLRRSIEMDPAFRVLSIDRNWWFCPYTGKAVAIGSSLNESIARYLLEEEPWQTYQPLPAQNIRLLAWRYNCVRLLQDEPRMRMFVDKGRCWLNPFNGEIDARVHLGADGIDQTCVERMAGQLAVCSKAMDGVMLSMDELRMIAKRHRARRKCRKVKNQTTQEHRRVQQQQRSKARSTQNHIHRFDALPPGYELGRRLEPLDEVTGDLAASVSISSYRQLILLGDISGHGVHAAMIGAMLVKAARELVRDWQDLTLFMQRLNEIMLPEFGPGQFATVNAVMLDALNNECTCVLSGHHPGFIIDAQHGPMLRHLGTPGMSIGLRDGQLFDNSLAPQTLSLPPGAILVLTSDGILEAQGERAEEFGHHRTTMNALSKIHEGPQVVADHLVDTAFSYAGGQVDDDLSAIAVRRTADV